MVLSPDEKGQLKGAGYDYRAKQSYFEELVLNGAQGRNRTTDTRIFSPEGY